MIAYKVVHKITSNVYCSVLADGRAKIVYQIGELVIIPDWLKEHGMFPLLFSSLDTAIRWQDAILANGKYFRILICDAHEQVLRPVKLRLDFLTIGEIKASDCSEFPIGTVSYKQVIPIREYEYAETDSCLYL
jgi:hypothetical protein